MNAALVIKLNIFLLVLGNLACTAQKPRQLPRGSRPPLDAPQLPNPSGGNGSAEVLDYGGPVHKIYGPQLPKLGCSSPSIRTINVPIDHFDSGSETFAYRFEHIIANPAATTVIYIPGGPGQDSINVGDSPIPDGFNKVHIDPRGVGCNFYEDKRIPHFRLSTENHAMDILAVIKELRLTDYIVYGISYGTEAGTVVASKAHADPEVVAPKALVLEGVIGEAYDKEINQPRSMVQIWRRILEVLPEAADLFEDDNNLPLGYDTFDWLDIVYGHMVFDPRDFLAVLDLLLDDPNDPDIQDFYDSFFFGGDEVDGPVSGNPGESAFFEWVNCRELDPIITETAYLTEGRMQLGFLRPDEYQCNGFALVNRYDSQDYPLGDTVVYYFQGNMDVLTDISGARYHEAVTRERNQTYFVELDIAGHNPLNIELEECNPQVWGAIASLADPATVLDANNDCPGSLGLRSSGPSLRKKKFYR